MSWKRLSTQAYLKEENFVSILIEEWVPYSVLIRYMMRIRMIKIKENKMKGSQMTKTKINKNRLY